MPKEYSIKLGGRGRDRVTTATLDQLVKDFSYTLEIGASWNKKINRFPKTIKSFVKNLQAAYEQKESACYNRTFVELIETQ
jgi:hypothetical protein